MSTGAGAPGSACLAAWAEEASSRPAPMTTEIRRYSMYYPLWIRLAGGRTPPAAPVYTGLGFGQLLRRIGSGKTQCFCEGDGNGMCRSRSGVEHEPAPGPPSLIIPGMELSSIIKCGVSAPWVLARA